jgi:hypothetical protein
MLAGNFIRVATRGGAYVNRRRINRDGQDEQDEKEMRNDECGMMNDELKTAWLSSFIIPHSSFRICLHPAYPVHPC